LQIICVIRELYTEDINKYYNSIKKLDIGFLPNTKRFEYTSLQRRYTNDQ
jgi:hypothetical protein